ncbi:MAG: DUF4114 domain-containing protein [Nitrospira sp.]|nr:DUF4114 domain-containing protein [Nitrospira sp.]
MNHQMISVKRSIRLWMISLFMVMLVFVAGVADAFHGAPIIVSETGNVFVEYLGSEAYFTNQLYLHSPGKALGMIFNNKTSRIGETFFLGSFREGSELIFRLNTTVDEYEFDWYSGDADRNVDKTVHALVTIPRDDFKGRSFETYVGFEDVLYGGDFDYNDMRFKVQFKGSIPAVVPEPVSTTLFLVGASVLGLRQLRSRKSKPLLQKSSETFVS